MLILFKTTIFVFEHFSMYVICVFNKMYIKYNYGFMRCIDLCPYCLTVSVLLSLTVARTSAKNVCSYLCIRRDGKMTVGHTCIVEVNLGSCFFFFCKNTFKSDFSRFKFQTFLHFFQFVIK